MADKDPNPGHSMFGLNDEPTRRAPAPEDTTAAPHPYPEPLNTFMFSPLHNRSPPREGGKRCPGC